MKNLDQVHFLLPPVGTLINSNTGGSKSQELFTTYCWDIPFNNPDTTYTETMFVLLYRPKYGKNWKIYKAKSGYPAVLSATDALFIADDIAAEYTVVEPNEILTIDR